jgi:hypothetical protein
MGSSTSTMLSIAGLAVGAYGVYYLHTNGYFEKILGALPKGGGTGELYPGEKEDEAKTPGGTPPPDAKGNCTGGKVLCKDQKCESQAECDKEGKCKSGEHWDGPSQKCVKAAKMASVGYLAAYHGWKPYNHRITVV